MCRLYSIKIISTINVYRAAGYGDCTNNGVSARHDTLIVVNAEGPVEVRDKDLDRCVMMELTQYDVLRLVPIEPDEYNSPPWRVREGWFMMGGNFGHSSDSRFHELAEKLLGQAFYGAVAIHDRLEEVKGNEVLRIHSHSG